MEFSPQFDANGYWSSLSAALTNAYFGGRRVGELNDRLGSRTGLASTFYPYGQEKAVTTDGKYKFATYWRDLSTGLDYADRKRQTNPG